VVTTDDARGGPGPTPAPGPVAQAAQTPDLERLLAPRSVVVVGATDRPGSYAAQTLLNLQRAGFTGGLAGVHPRRGEILGVPCGPDLAGALSILGGPADAVVIATTAVTVPDYLAEAGRLGCGGAVVFATGFAESGDRAAEQRLIAAAGRYGLPVLGPNTSGLVSFRSRAPLWTDPVNLAPGAEDDGIALITESGNAGLLALAHRRGTGLHSVISVGNAAVVDAPTVLLNLARAEGLRAIALYLERIPDGARLASALAVAARSDVRLAVLRTGRHGPDEGPGRVLDALFEEAGAIACRDVHQLIETTRALARGRRTDRAVAVVTSTAGDAALAADLAADAGVELADLSKTTRDDLAGQLPRTVVPANPLNHTTQLWADADAMARITAAVAADPGVGAVLYVQDEPPGLHPEDSAEWLATRAGARLGGAREDVDVLLVAGMPGQEPAGAVSGLPAAMTAMARLRQPAPEAARLVRIANAAVRVPGGTPAAGLLAEHAAKALLDEAGIDVLRHAVVPVPPDEKDKEAVSTAVALAAAQIGFPVTLRLSAPGNGCGAESPSLSSGDQVSRKVAEILLEASTLEEQNRCDAALLVEARARPGVLLTLTAHREGPVPALIIGLGGAWAQVLGDTRTVPLPADARRIALAVASLPGTATADLTTAGEAGRKLSDLFLEGGFAELRVTFCEGTAVRAQARRLT
jgi:acyl-CoA synthetase (NDP forming)